MTTCSNALTTYLQDEIALQGGDISFARFMEIALYHPDGGYYQSPDFTLGKEGDFTTAPELSPLFAHCFANYCQTIFAMADFNAILELGAGTGQFALDILSQLAKQHHAPVHYYIYEISPVLRHKQQALLQSARPDLLQRVTWLTELPLHFRGVIIANEVLDALPVHCFRIEQQQVLERRVGVSNDHFVWKQARPKHCQLLAKIEHLRDQYALSDGYESEISLEIPNFIQAISQTLEAGVALFIDYGYGQTEYYHPERKHGTLTCFYHHRHHADPLVLPGLQDITAHVDFTLLAESALAHGLTLAGYTTQAAFLFACSLMDLAAEAEKKLSPLEQFNLHQAIKQLTLPTEMGERIKIMAISKQIDLPLPGFNLQDRRRDL